MFLNTTPKTYHAEWVSLIVDPDHQGKIIIFEKPIEEKGKHLKPLYILELTLMTNLEK